MLAEPETLDSVFVGPFAYLAGKVRIEGDLGPAVSVSRLSDPTILGRELDTYCGRFGPACRAPVASLWSQYFLGGLIVPFVAIGLLGNRMPDLSPEGIGVVLEEGLPAGLVLSGLGAPIPRGGSPAGFECLVRELIHPVIDALVEWSCGAPRLFWGNAATLMSWAVREAGTMLPGSAEPDRVMERLLGSRNWADGVPNMLHGQLRLETGDTVGRRRVCCVRYCLPGVPGCGPVCPLER